MNYRHAFHAGNFADCFKHALLVWLVRALQRKSTPIFVLDTHAGSGRYDLQAAPALRTGEAHSGIFRLLEAPPAALADYLGLVQALGLYPGSPAIVRALLRDDDRLACCELHPAEAAALKAAFAGDRQVGVHHRDGYESVRALLPPAERRGLVLIDPPYEREDEALRVAKTLAVARSRFPGGVLAAWYPVKHRAPVRALLDAVRASGLRDVVTAELLLRAPDDATRLNGCGLLIVSPPYGLENEINTRLDALLATLGDGETGQAACVTRIIPE